MHRGKGRLLQQGAECAVEAANHDTVVLKREANFPVPVGTVRRERGREFK